MLKQSSNDDSIHDIRIIPPENHEEILRPLNCLCVRVVAANFITAMPPLPLVHNGDLFSG